METIVFGKKWEFRNHLELVKEQGLGRKDSNPARSLSLSIDRPKEPETPQAEGALSTAPVRKEPPAARE